MTHYDFTRAKKAIAERGMFVDEEMLAHFDAWAKVNKMDEFAVNSLVIIHVDAICRFLNPKSYPWMARIKIAFLMFAMFIGIFTPKFLRGTNV